MDPRLPLSEIPDYAQRVEQLGFDGLQVAETIHDSLAACLIALEHTRGLTVRSAVTLAFVRSPTLTAYTAWDLSRFSGGRFELGLGSQIRQNIQDRFGMPWSEPVSRLGDYIGALSALFGAFRTGEPVRYDGDPYRLSRLQPYFNPGPDLDTEAPRIWLGGVSPRMCQLAGEVAVGVITHPTNSHPRYLRDVVRPNLAAGAQRSGRPPTDLRTSVPATIATGVTDDDVSAERERQRKLLAFLYSTPAYQATLDMLGHPELPERLRELIRADGWTRLADVMTDDVLDGVLICGRYDDLPALIHERYDGLADEIVLPPLPAADGDAALAHAVAELGGSEAHA